MVQGSALDALVQAPAVDLAGARRTSWRLRNLHWGRGRVYGVRFSGRVLELSTLFDSQYVSEQPWDRGSIGGFSAKSRRNLMKLCAGIPWALFERRMFTTLTYPTEFPCDGRQVKRHLEAFRSRFERRFGKQAVVWKLEFQRRGAPHFHLLLSLPGSVDVLEFRAWLSEAWYGVVGSGDVLHLLAGTQVQIADTDCGRYFAYGVKSTGSKEYQNCVPVGFENVGRFWGAWNVAPEWRGAQISEGDFFELRRRVCAWSKSKGGYVPRRSRVQGAWTLTEGKSAALVLSQLGRGLVSVERAVR